MTVTTKETKEVTSPSKHEIMTVYNVRRYGAAGRIYHWIHAAAMMLFISTGWQIYTQDLILGDMGIVRAIHISLGIFIILWDLICQPALLAIDGHFKDIIPTPGDVRDLIVIFLCTLRIIGDEHYPHYDFYDPDLGIYIRKYHPGQKFLSITDMVAMLFMGSTGIAMAEAAQAGSTGIMSFMTVFNIILVPFLDLFGISFRLFHFFLFIFFTLTTFFHIYFALIPQNIARLKAMVTGTEDISGEN
ncbi:MAG: hypothetical protein ACFFD1_04800 [Candidatus Thorarchaeota archaeon]